MAGLEAAAVQEAFPFFGLHHNLVSHPDHKGMFFLLLEEL
jgi:hypothetical protein